MNTLLHLFRTLPLISISFTCLILFFIFSICLYIYVNINLKGICKIIVDDDNWYKMPLSPLTFHLLSALPLVFFKEFLNIKFNINFKKLYGKNYYFSLNCSDLESLLRKYPVFFYMQYIIFFLGILFIVFLLISMI